MIKQKRKPIITLFLFIQSFFSTSYPISIGYENNNSMYFVGIRSLSLWHGQIDKMINGTSEGLKEIPIPLEDVFQTIPKYEIGIGSLAVDKEKKEFGLQL
ncbi:hypothetical protein BH23THE1_BH23THE1_07650 [soil metagenome]